VGPEQHRAVTARLVEAVGKLAPRTDDAHVRAQLHALAGVVENLTVDPFANDPEDTAEVDTALEEGDEAAAIRTARRVAAARRAQVSRIDWSRASGT
jgi:hypothetical protein